MGRTVGDHGFLHGIVRAVGGRGGRTGHRRDGGLPPIGGRGVAGATHRRGGLRTAESLRANGYTGSIVIVGDEKYRAYNRPPLSKEALKSGIAPEDLYFRQRDSVADVHWLLGEPATQLSLAHKTVSLANG